MKLRIALSACAGLLLLATQSANAAVVFGQIDDFEDGTTQGWTNGHAGTGEVNVTTGGPDGAGDHYLQLSSGSFGGQSREVMFNQAQWTGDYLSAGVTMIEMDLKNFGSSALPIRIALRSGTGGAPTPAYVTTTAFTLPTDSQWHHVTFFLDAGNLTAFNSPPTLDTLLSNVPDFRILSATTPIPLGDVLNAQIGVDNIAAVPEPATTAFIGGAAALLVLGLRRRRG